MLFRSIVAIHVDRSAVWIALLKLQIAGHFDLFRQIVTSKHFVRPQRCVRPATVNQRVRIVGYGLRKVALRPIESGNDLPTVRHALGCAEFERTVIRTLLERGQVIVRCQGNQPFENSDLLVHGRFDHTI